MALVKDVKVGDTVELPGFGKIRLDWKSGQRVKLRFDLADHQEIRIIKDASLDPASESGE